MKEYIPIIQFGQFSPTFEFKLLKIGYIDIIDIVSFLTLPIIFTERPIDCFRIDDRYIYINTEEYKNIIYLFQQQLLKKPNFSLDLKQEFTNRLEWEGWNIALTNERNQEFLQLVIKQYFCLSQLIWLGAIMKDVIVKKYQNTLKSFFLTLDEQEFEEFFLDTITIPSSSYILQACINRQNSSAKEFRKNILIEKKNSACIQKMANRMKEGVTRHNKAISKIIQHPDHRVKDLVNYLDLIRILTWFAEEKNLHFKEHKKTVYELLPTYDPSLLMTSIGLEDKFIPNNILDLILPMINYFKDHSLKF